MNESGLLRIWLTAAPVERMALDVCARLTMDGGRLLVLDAAGCLNPSRFSRAAAPVARNVVVVGVNAEADPLNSLSEMLQTAQSREPIQRVLLTGLLDPLCQSQVLTRETAREVGRIKLFLEGLAAAGLEVTVLCQAASGLGTRSYVLASLCAAAQEVHNPARPAPASLDRVSAAIA
jgi:hypothetical protein